MARKQRILFLQLPQLDNDISGAHENTPLAACYLEHALRRSREHPHFTCLRLRPNDEHLADAGLIRRIQALKPDILAFTLYLWNIERSLDLAARLKRAHPSVFLLAGGPEVSRGHPFLFKRAVMNAVAAGEGEPVFPDILRAFRLRSSTDYQNVAWLSNSGYRWGRQPPPAQSLRDMLPPPSWLRRHARTGNMACMETTRGCPMRCAYCSYHQQRSRHTALPAGEALAIIQKLKKGGVKEIRFIDPTFNANPAMDEILRGMATLNRNRAIQCFAELRADRITREQARLLAQAGFTDIEVGVQTLNPKVLRAIHRPPATRQLDQGIRFLTAAGIRVTLDLMYGLPGQTLKDMQKAVRWASGRRRVRVQCLQTLLLPGTELRDKRRAWQLAASDKPPYAVTGTPQMNSRALALAEAFIEKTIGAQYDCPSRRFAGRSLPDLFTEQVHAPSDPNTPLPGQASRRALFFDASTYSAAGPEASFLYSRRSAILQTIRRALTEEPHILWQFVLVPEQEEPLELLDLIIAELRRHSRHPLDHFLGAHRSHLLASRRLFVLLKKGRRFSLSWKNACEESLRSSFY